jgi:hypothetical protein
VYRAKPFWAWNGRLEPQELRRQIRIMRQMGLGGFFMHSRVGLDTEYLSGQWFDCIQACIDEAKKLGLEAWLYDEDRWPSGAAGGLVTRNPAYRMRRLSLERLEEAGELEWNKNLLAVFVARVEEDSVRQVRRLQRTEVPASLSREESILAFRLEVHPDSDWYNGQAYLDTLNPEAVREFIRITHRQYRRRFGGEFGKSVSGIFTDEPNYGHLFGWDGDESHICWTDRLPEEFCSRYGYDLLDHLVELVYEVEEVPVSRARYHYLDCLTYLFVASFARQVGRFCRRTVLPFTGHLLREETLSAQSTAVGSAMRFYEHMEIPGMDLLTEHTREYDTAKQVSSAARQFGRRWRLTETYGCTGWDFPFAGHKALGDWQAALGINLRSQHLAWYTMRGEAKRDYPAGIFYHSPWWHLYPKVEDYFARLHVALSRGEEVRDLLVIHPVESMWLLMHRGWRRDPRVRRLDRMLVKLRDTLLCAHLDFDYGEEEILSRHGRVEGSGASVALAVAGARYSAVLVPPLTTIRSTTLDLLAAFRGAGGLVVFAGKAPSYVDALPSQAARELAARCAGAPAQGPELAAAVEATRRISITGPQGGELAPVLYLLREDERAFYLFLCNTSLSPKQMKPAVSGEDFVRNRRESFPSVVIQGFAGCGGTPLELDPDSGSVFRTRAGKRAGGWEIRTHLPPLASRLFLVPKNRQSRLPPPRRAYRELRSRSLGSGGWPIALSEANVLVLDRPGFRIGREAWRKPEDILRVDRAVRDVLGLPHRGGRMKQPWVVGKPAAKYVQVTLRYDFQVEAVPGGELFLALESVEHFEISLNGHPISKEVECGWWVDPSLRKLPVDAAFLRSGSNEITLVCDYREDFSGLEIVYLLGNFGVGVRGTRLTLGRPPEKLDPGDWVPQGLAFYSGNVAYLWTIDPKLRKGERLFVQVPEYQAVAVRITVNGAEAGIIAWEPNEVDVTDFLGKGPSELRVEVTGHRRNSHGPLHHAHTWPEWTGPQTFVTSGSLWTERYNLVPCGLMCPPRLLVRAPIRTE